MSALRNKTPRDKYFCSSLVSSRDLPSFQHTTSIWLFLQQYYPNEILSACLARLVLMFLFLINVFESELYSLIAFPQGI